MTETPERPNDSPGPSEAPKTPPIYNDAKESLKILRETALKLYEAGYNIVIVDCDKKPLTSWSKSGLAERFNNGHRFKKYILKPKGLWISYFETCRKRRFKCKNCFFKSSCPYVITVK
jgi:hypothetical protein